MNLYLKHSNLHYGFLLFLCCWISEQATSKFSEFNAWRLLMPLSDKMTASWINHTLRHMSEWELLFILHLPVLPCDGQANCPESTPLIFHSPLEIDASFPKTLQDSEITVSHWEYLYIKTCIRNFLKSRVCGISGFYSHSWRWPWWVHLAPFAQSSSAHYTVGLRVSQAVICLTWWGYVTAVHQHIRGLWSNTSLNLLHLSKSYTSPKMGHTPKLEIAALSSLIF